MINEQLIKEWDYEKNKNFDFRKLKDGSHKKVWWRCIKGHVWETEIRLRVKGYGCPFCSNKKIGKDNSLLVVNKILAKEFHPTKNKIKASELSPSSGKKVWWKCFKGHEWQAKVNNRQNGSGCPYCCFNGKNKKVTIENCLAVKHPEVAQSWDYSKNLISPYDVTWATSKRVWWKCPVSSDHSWEERVSVRINSNCPFCRGLKVCESNCLATTHPELSKEWHQKK